MFDYLSSLNNMSSLEKWFVTMHTGYCGSTAYELIELEATIPEKERERIFYGMAEDNAESYGYEMCTDDCEDPECEMEHPGTTNIEGVGVIYDPEEHDGYLY